MKHTLLLLALLVGASANAKTIEIKMKNNGTDGMMTFEPGYVQAAVGDTINFLPSEPGHNTASLHVPVGAKTWASKPDNKPFQVPLTKEGIYIYKCDPHLAMAMVGVIQVGKASNLEDAKKAGSSLAPTFAMNKDRLTKYLNQVK